MKRKYDLSEIAMMFILSAALVGIAFVIIAAYRDKTMSKMDEELERAIVEQAALLSENIKLKREIQNLYKEREPMNAELKKQEGEK